MIFWGQRGFWGHGDQWCYHVGWGIEATEVLETTSVLEINKLMAKITLFWCFEKKIFFEQNDEISSEILPSFRTEAVEDRDVIFNQIQGS